MKLWGHVLIQSTNLSNYARNYATNHTSTAYNTKLSVAAVPLLLALKSPCPRSSLQSKRAEERGTAEQASKELFELGSFNRERTCWVSRLRPHEISNLIIIVLCQSIIILACQLTSKALHLLDGTSSKFLHRRRRCNVEWLSKQQMLVEKD